MEKDPRESSGTQRINAKGQKGIASMNYAQIGEILTEIAPRLDVVDLVAFESQSNWVMNLGIEDDEIFVVDYDSRREVLVFSTQLGQVPDENRSATYEFLLGYNLYWAETDGVRMALDISDGTVVQLFDLALSGVTASKLEAVVENFVGLARNMRLLVEAGIGEDERPPPPEFSTGPQGPSIRV